MLKIIKGAKYHIPTFQLYKFSCQEISAPRPSKNVLQGLTSRLGRMTIPSMQTAHSGVLVRLAQFYTSMVNTQGGNAMGTRSSIGCMMPNGEIEYVECRFDGYLSHVGRILVEHYNDLDKVLELLLGGDIVSLREDLEHTERESALGFDKIEDFIDCEVKEADWMGDYLLNGEGEYKYLFIKGMWYVVGGLYESDGVTPLMDPLTLAKAIEIWLR